METWCICYTIGVLDYVGSILLPLPVRWEQILKHPLLYVTQQPLPPFTPTDDLDVGRKESVIGLQGLARVGTCIGGISCPKDCDIIQQIKNLWQVKIHHWRKEKCAFETKSPHFHFKALPINYVTFPAYDIVPQKSTWVTHSPSSILSSRKTFTVMFWMTSLLRIKFPSTHTPLVPGIQTISLIFLQSICFLWHTEEFNYLFLFVCFPPPWYKPCELYLVSPTSLKIITCSQNLATLFL